MSENKAAGNSMIMASAVSLIAMGALGWILSMGFINAGRFRIRIETLTILFAFAAMGALAFAVTAMLAGLQTKKQLAFLFPAITAFLASVWLFNIAFNAVPIYMHMQPFFFGLRLRSLFPEFDMFSMIVYINLPPVILNLLFAVALLVMMWILRKAMPRAGRILTIIATVILCFNILFWIVLAVLGAKDYGVYPYGSAVLGYVCCAAALIQYRKAEASSDL